MRKGILVAAALLVFAGGACKRTPTPRQVLWTALGTEPFWSVEVATDVITLRRPGVPDVIWPSAAPSEVRPRDAALDDSGAVQARIWRARRSASDALLEVVIRPEPCSDGMSDRRYPATVTLRWQDTTRTGCAVPGRPTDGANGPRP